MGHKVHPLAQGILPFQFNNRKGSLAVQCQHSPDISSSIFSPAETCEHLEYVSYALSLVIVIPTSPVSHSRSLVPRIFRSSACISTVCYTSLFRICRTTPPRLSRPVTPSTLVLTPICVRPYRVIYLPTCIKFFKSFLIQRPMSHSLIFGPISCNRFIRPSWMISPMEAFRRHPSCTSQMLSIAPCELAIPTRNCWSSYMATADNNSKRARTVELEGLRRNITSRNSSLFW
jgi:hypothetical protein